MNKQINKKIVFKCDELLEEAELLLLEKYGLSNNHNYTKILRRKMYDVFEKIKGNIIPRAVISFFDRKSIVLSGKCLFINDIRIKCNAFEQISPDILKGVFVCFISAGDLLLEYSSVGEQLLADLWGTAFVDVTRKRLMDIIGEKINISEEFGPGFYGMSMSEMKKLSVFVDASQIGISIKENGMLVPVKSCGNIILEVSEDYTHMDSTCRDCIGSTKSCYLCKYSGR